ncbi:hypothetical protein [Actinophytocola glycyrrhizae]|uniref:Uncharacterized protein n=1 Tax=Actinophytocola glycyrrhizae TaxID=2044873 RepID=A0ABV9RYG2_9PSEU
MLCRRFVVAVLLLGGVLTACSGSNPAEHFCDDYGDAVGKLYVAAGDYAVAPDQFAAVARSTMDELSRVRAGAPNDDLRRAFDSAYFSMTVFSEDDGLADFLVRTDFAHDDVVKACAEYGIELRPDAA